MTIIELIDKYPGHTLIAIFLMCWCLSAIAQGIGNGLGKKK